MYMEKAIVPMLQLLTCVQFIGFLGISASDFHLCWLLHVFAFLKLLAGVMCCCIACFLLRCLCFFFILLSPFLSCFFFLLQVSSVHSSPTMFAFFLLSCLFAFFLLRCLLLSFFFDAFVSSSFRFLRFFPCFFFCVFHVRSGFCFLYA